MVYNVDGTLNKKGTTRNYVDLPLTIFGKTKMEQLMVTGLGKVKIILGFPWLKEQNPIINWQTGRMFFHNNKNSKLSWLHRIKTPKISIQEEIDKEEWKN